MTATATGEPLGLSPSDVRSLARTLCADRHQNPDGMLYGFPGATDGVTFLTLAERDVRTVLQALAKLPALRVQ